MFVDGSGGQYAIPLSFVGFSASGSIDVSTWPGWAGVSDPADQVNVGKWVAGLAGQRLLTAAVLPLPPAAFSIVARDAGSSGNDITISFGAVTPNAPTPSAATVDVTVATTQTYAGLTVTSVAGVLGTAPLGGSAPGLAYVSTPLWSLPKDAAATNFAGTPPVYDIAGSGGVLSATHAAAAEIADAQALQAAISQVAGGTFTLTLTWTKSESALKLSDLAATHQRIAGRGDGARLRRGGY